MDASDSAAPPTNRSKKILCIEDEHFISELYSRALSKAGYDVTVVVDGEQGLKEAQSDRYDIILLDIMIPNMLGINILKTLRDPAKTPQLHSKIIITTNLDQGEEGRAEIERQADGYLIKAEITPKQLVQFLDNIR